MQQNREPRSFDLLDAIIILAQQKPSLKTSLLKKIGKEDEINKLLSEFKKTIEKIIPNLLSYDINPEEAKKELLLFLQNQKNFSTTQTLYNIANQLNNLSKANLNRSSFFSKERNNNIQKLTVFITKGLAPLTNPLNLQNATVKRPPNIKTAIEDTANHLQSLIKKGGTRYLHEGEEKDTGEYTYMFNGFELNNLQLVQNRAKSFKNARDPMIVFDMGPGKGKPVRMINAMVEEGLNLCCYGMDIREYDQKDPLSQFVKTGNLEEFDQEFKKQFGSQFKPDITFSRLVFRHFIDPASALIQAFEQLKVGGILIIDNFILPGCEGRLNNLIEYLRNQGYDIIASCTQQEITNLAIKKTSEDQHLVLPLEYSRLEYNNVNEKYQVIYSISPIIEYDNSWDFSIEAKKDIGQRIQQLGIADFLSKQNSLESMFQDPSYLELPLEKQYFSILGLTLKLIPDQNSYQRLEKAVIALTNDTQTHARTVMKSSSGRNDMEGLFTLMNHSYFKTLSKDTQIQLIQYVALGDALLLGKQLKTGDEMKKMDLNLSRSPLPWEGKIPRHLQLILPASESKAEHRISRKP